MSSFFVFCRRSFTTSQGVLDFYLHMCCVLWRPIAQNYGIVLLGLCQKERACPYTHCFFFDLTPILPVFVAAHDRFNASWGVFIFKALTRMHYVRSCACIARKLLQYDPSFALLHFCHLHNHEKVATHELEKLARATFRFWVAPHFLGCACVCVDVVGVGHKHNARLTPQTVILSRQGRVKQLSSCINRQVFPQNKGEILIWTYRMSMTHCILSWKSGRLWYELNMKRFVLLWHVCCCRQSWSTALALHRTRFTCTLKTRRYWSTP